MTPVRCAIFWYKQPDYEFDLPTTMRCALLLVELPSSQGIWTTKASSHCAMHFAGLSDEDAATLGPLIGGQILVDGRWYERGRPHDGEVRPASAYLPAAMDTGKRSSPGRAGRTPGIKWVHPALRARPSGLPHSGKKNGAVDLETERRARRCSTPTPRRAEPLYGTRRRERPTAGSMSREAVALRPQCEAGLLRSARRAAAGTTKWPCSRS